MTGSAVATALRKLDEEFFTGVLQDGGHPEAVVRSVRPEPMAMTGAIADIARINLDYEPEGATGPSSVIAKIRGSNGIQVQLDSMMGLYDREAHFYSAVASKTPVNTPRCYHVGDGTNTPLIFEDLQGLRSGDLQAGLGVPECERLVDVFADMHARYWQSPVLDEGWLASLSDGPWAEMVIKFVQEGIATLQDQCEGLVPEPVLAAAGDVAGRWGQVLVHLTEGPKTLIHNDCRPDNIFFEPNGDPVIIDWQNIAANRGVHDIGYLLAASVEPEVLSDHWEPLLRRYHNRLCGHGVEGYAWNDCVDHYRQSVIYPLAAAIGLLVQADTGDGRGLVVGRRVLLHAADVDSFSVV